MAKIYGGRSKYLVKNDIKFFTIGDFIIPVVFLLFCYYMFKFLSNISNLKINPYIIVIIMFTVIIFIKKFGKNSLKLQKISRRISNNFYRGWRGEENILNVLKTLPDNYTIFCDVNLYNKGNIDFVVLGPCGLLAVEVKSHPGKITFENGRLLRNGYPFKEKDFVIQAKNEALDLNHFLIEKIQKDIFVKPIIVFSNKYAKMRFGLNPINNVFVVQKEFLIKLIESLPEAMSRDEAGGIERELSKLYSK